MENLECANSGACRQYCEALRAQGADIEFSENGCNAPSLFEITEDSVVFNPGEYNSEASPTLVNSLGGALCDVLVQHQQSANEIKQSEKLEALYDARLNAQMDLWKAMMSSTRTRRTFTDAECEHYEKAITYVDESLADIGEQSPEEAILRAQAVFDRKTIEQHGLVFDDQITEVANRLTGNLMDGKPSLLVGDKGIAKTQVARFVARLWDGEDREPMIISGHGDQMTDEFMGKVVQDKDTKTFSFKEGKLVEAMREGRPVILDEVNISDQAIVMRLQDVLLRRPGQKIVLQENGGEEIEIQPGFVVFATANEASARYQHRTQLDPAFRDRFNVVGLNYPDVDTAPITDIPHSLMRLALASAVDENGELSPHTPANVVETMARLAHATQHLYSVPAKNVRISSLRPDQDTTGFLQGSEEPIMTDCITPRALVETIRRCSAGNKPGMDLRVEVERLVISLDQAGSSSNRKHARKALELLGGQSQNEQE
jgi:hypothetical protein